MNYWPHPKHHVWWWRTIVGWYPNIGSDWLKLVLANPHPDPIHGRVFIPTPTVSTP